MRYKTSRKSYITLLRASHWPELVIRPYFASKGAKKCSVYSVWQCTRIKYQGPLLRNKKKMVLGIISNLSCSIYRVRQTLRFTGIIKSSLFNQAWSLSSCKIPLFTCSIKESKGTREKERHLRLLSQQREESSFLYTPENVSSNVTGHN